MSEGCGNCDGSCHSDEKDEKKVTLFGKTFWDLWFQKMFRNIASVKYQWLLFLSVPTFWAMFTGHWHIPADFAKPEFVPMLDHTIGYTFLGGGFVTIATSRIIARTKLTEPTSDNVLDTDK